MITDKNRERHAKDALIALTAGHHDAVLVTRDKRLTNKVRAQGIEVLDPPGLVERLTAM